MELLDKGLDYLGITNKVRLGFNITFAIIMVIIYGGFVSSIAYTKYHNWYIAAIPLVVMIPLSVNFILKSVDLYIVLSKKE